MKRKIKFGIVGCGWVAEFAHAMSIIECKNAELVATCDVVEEKAKTMAKKHGAEKWYTDYSKMLKDEEIDVVDICLPHKFHCNYAVLAAEAGKHVFCEKPMAITVEECDKMIKAARKAGMKLMIGHNKRFDPTYEMAKRLINEGYIGEIVMGLGRYCGSQEWLQSVAPTPWRFKAGIAGGGPLMDQGPHYVDLLIWLFSMKVERVSALQARMNTKLTPPDLEDTIAMLMQFDNRAIGIVKSSMAVKVQFHREEGIEIWGSEGKVKTSGLGLEVGPFPAIEVYTKKTIPEWFSGMIIPESRYNPMLSFKREISHFVECILKDKKPRITGEEAKKTVECISAAYESVRTGKTISLS